jgi:hypothetical protein
VESPLGSADGLMILQSMVESLAGTSAKPGESESRNIHTAVRA